MDIKLRSRLLQFLIFVLSIYLLALSLFAAFDVIRYRRHLNKDYYFKSYSFKVQLLEYAQNVRTILTNKDVTAPESNNAIKSLGAIKYYIKNKNTNEVYTNIEDASDINGFIKDKALYSETFPKEPSSDSYYESLNRWFQNNSFEGSFIVLKKPDGYSQILNDYRYYNSVRERIIKEIIILVISLPIGLILLILFTRKNKSIMGFTALYERIPLDVRGFLFLVSAPIIGLYMRNVFFYLPVTIRHFATLTGAAAFVIYLIINFISFIRFFNDGEFKNQLQRSLLYQWIMLIRESFQTKGILGKMGLLILSTVLLGMFTAASVIGLSRNNDGLLILSAGYIFVYILIVPIYLLKKIAALNRIIKGTDEIVSGNLDYFIDVKEDSNLSKLAHNINNMKDSFRKSVENQVKSERLKTELITNVSHDLKTPLTSIINYISLLKKEGLSADEASAYIDVLDRKSQRLKILIDDLFEASKMSSGSVDLNIERVDIAALLRQALGEFDEKINSSSLTFKAAIPPHNVYLNLDGKKTWRVFENLISNILKYSQPNTRVYIDLIEKEDKVIVTMKNISAYEMDFDVDEIFERFKRGDKSRSTEGSGLGLAIAKSIVELQGGTMSIEVEADLFKVKIVFNR